MPEPTWGNGLPRAGGYNETQVMGGRLSSLLIALLLTTVACGRPEDPPASATYRAETPAVAQTAAVAESSRPRIVFLGDSLTAGLGLPRAQSVPSLIQTRLDTSGYRYEVVNAGVSGDTSAGGLRRLDWALDGDVLIIGSDVGTARAAIDTIAGRLPSIDEDAGFTAATAELPTEVLGLVYVDVEHLMEALPIPVAPTPGAASYPASTRFGVTSSTWGPWVCSFIVP